MKTMGRRVNLCELTVTHPDDKVVYKNAFATRHHLSYDRVEEVVLAARTR